MNTVVSNPVLPGFMVAPLGLFPGIARRVVLEKALNRIFLQYLEDGSLAFLDQARLGVDVVDARLKFSLTLENNALVVTDDMNGCNLNIRGNLYDFMLLAARREDADTLFFQRRLKMQGDTEIGLELKNFLDAVEVESLPYHQAMEFALGKGIPLFERLFGHDQK